MNDFDLNKPLPTVITIKCAQNHLYSIGLAFETFQTQTRNRFHNSFFIWFIICVSMHRSIIAILMKEDKYWLETSLIYSMVGILWMRRSFYLYIWLWLWLFEWFINNLIFSPKILVLFAAFFLKTVEMFILNKN
jgi:hypothetical protein